MTALGIEGSADLALALGISRVLRRVRLPIDLLGAAVLAAAYPPLTQVNLSRLFVPAAAAAAPGADVAAAVPPPVAEQSGGGALATLRHAAMDGVRVVGRVVDRYGLALTVAQASTCWNVRGWRGEVHFSAPMC